MGEYKKENITDTYYTIDILDSCWKISGDVYDEISRKSCPQDLLGACRRVVEMINHDRELGEEIGGKWEYRVIKHEEDDENDWQTAYKVYKYRGRWRYKVDYDY